MPLIRIVRMTIASDHENDFLAAFDEAAPQIRAQPGCEHLELWKEEASSNIFVTYSVWQSQEALDEYRQTPFFETTWIHIKTYFAARPSVDNFELLRQHS